MSVTIKDIARLVGVSYSTVAKALNDSPLVKPATKKKIVQAAEQLGYKPNFAARMLVTGRTGIIGAVWPTVERTFLSALLTEIQRELLNHRYTMLLSIHAGQEAIRLFEQLRLDGVLEFEGAALGETPLSTPSSMPLLTIGKTDRPSVSYIDINRRLSIRLAVERLAERGYRKIAYVGKEDPAAQNSEKMTGYFEGLSMCGLPADPSWVLRTSGNDWEQGYIAAKRLLELADKPQAIVSSGYDLTTGIVRALQASGVRMPEDMALVSYDNMPHLERLEVPVSAVGVPLDVLARTVAETMAGLAQSPETAPVVKSLMPEYVRRKSD
ncbi:LacI family DNA-binding transcriptional regulator [Paenibacillus hamazuiensis]|uniref:LacI family DNA-binding transcriptional regulator n=1 Tax=Paenibacillus hamazuiensis TaxID=2936508 RepID=UPI00200BE26D|nr:LacI family DNA-binding transcriptional regulator [Paenibacillus hamazuiensis]